MKTYYKSELKELEGKEFTDVKELEKAEAEVAENSKKKEIALAEKKAELAKINESANTYLKLVAENNKKREELRKVEEEAYKSYKKELEDFAEKHQGYHLTYRKDGDNVEFQIEEAKNQTLENYYKESQETFNKLFNNFFNAFWF